MNANTYSKPSTAGGNREDLRNVLTILEPEDTPFTSLVKKGPAPKATYVEVLADTLRKPRTTGSREGTDANRGGNKVTNRQRFGTYVHRVFDEFGVTDVQQIVSEKGGVAAVADEYANSKAKCIREVKRDIEAINCGGQDHQGGSEKEMQTRGAFAWIQSSFQSANTVPTNFQPPSAALLTGVGTTVPLFTEKQFNAILKALKGVYGGKRTYQGIGGDDAIDTCDQFTRVNENTTNVRYRVNEMATAHEITMMVQVFESSFGRVELTPTQFNKLTASNVGDPDTMLILNMALWEMDMFDGLHAAEIEDAGGGPQGYVKEMHALLCLNPKGNGCIYNT